MLSSVAIIFLLSLIFFFGFIVFLRYLHHKEQMALISHGINPASQPRRQRSRGILRAGLITAMIGLALTIGLYPLGFLLPTIFTGTPFHLGPWLLPGLIPLAVGVALIVSYYLEQNSSLPYNEKDTDELEQDNITSLEERRERERRERG
jgi:hypothetical protein